MGSFCNNVSERYYTEKAIEDQACVMKTTVINTSKEIMAYSDFLIPKEFPIYMHNTKVIEYFKMYSERIGAEKYTKFNTEVMKVKEAGDFQTSGKWELHIKDHKNDVTSTEIFDGVLLCTGHHAEKNLPTFEGKHRWLHMYIPLAYHLYYLHMIYKLRWLLSDIKTHSI